MDLNTSQAFLQAPRAPDITQYTLAGIQKHKKPLRANTRLTQISAHTLGIGASQTTHLRRQILPVLKLQQLQNHPSQSTRHQHQQYLTPCHLRISEQPLRQRPQAKPLRPPTGDSKEIRPKYSLETVPRATDSSSHSDSSKQPTETTNK